jgi:hypothetical protein
MAWPRTSEVYTRGVVENTMWQGYGVRGDGAFHTMHHALALHYGRIAIFTFQSQFTNEAWHARKRHFCEVVEAWVRHSLHTRTDSRWQAMTVAMATSYVNYATVALHNKRPCEVAQWSTIGLVLIRVVEGTIVYQPTSLAYKERELARITVEEAIALAYPHCAVPALNRQIAASRVGARHVQLAGVIHSWIRYHRIIGDQRAYNAIVATPATFPCSLAIIAAKDNNAGGAGRANCRSRRGM